MELSKPGAKVPLNIRFRERKFQGTFVPGSESSTYGTFAPESESSWERKFHNSFVCVVRAVHHNVINSNEHTHAPKKLLSYLLTMLLTELIN